MAWLELGMGLGLGLLRMGLRRRFRLGMGLGIRLGTMGPVLGLARVLVQPMGLRRRSSTSVCAGSLPGLTGEAPTNPT